MRNYVWRWLILAVVIFLLDPASASAQGLLIPRGAVWKYLDNGSNQGTAWKELGFNDSSWKSGPARFGFGGDGEVTTTSFGPDANNKYVTTYFRKTFDVATPALVTALNLNLLRDDGAVVYLNGTEVRRDNMPTGTITPATFASGTIPNADEQVYFPSTVPVSLLVSGNNVIAVEVHQANATSSDLSFDLDLRGANIPPSVGIASPSNNGSFAAGANITLTANASDSDGTVLKVEFFQGSVKLGEAAKSPFSVVWNNVLEGTYTLTSVAADNEGATTTSAPITITVLDTSPPKLLSAVAAPDRVTLNFSKALATTSATDISHYSIDSGVRILTASFGSTPSSVILQTTSLAAGPTFTLTVNGIQDTAGNVVAPNSQVTFSLVPYISADIGGLPAAGSITFASGTYTLIGSGIDIGGTADQCFFSYQQLSGDFDMQVRVVGITPSDAWAKTGLMARESLQANARFAAMLTTPSLSGSIFESRSAIGGAATVAGSFPVNHPNTWLRLQRVGNQFNGYASFDARSWSQVGSANVALPTTIYFGMAASSHNPDQATIAQWRELEATAVRSVGAGALPWEPLGPSSRKTGLVISEIMYKPAPRSDGKVLDYVELFNSNPFFEDISSYRLTGEIDFTFPANTVLPGGAFLVVAKTPADVQNVYRMTNVVGPYQGSLKSSGTVRLRSGTGAILLEVPYSNQPPWPVAADGTGHSLVLARPSYGESNPEAWAASDVVGGSPGTTESYHPSPLRSVVINEFLAQTDPPLLDFIELYNHSNQAVDLSGCILTDDAASNKFVIPPGTVISPRGLTVFDESQLGFALSAAGETLYFKNPDQTRVIDTVQFEPQENGVSSGRSPDGAAEFYPLMSRTPGAANSNIRISEVTINEIMYAPISGDSRDQYVELYNQGGKPVDLSGWKFSSGINFTFPTNTALGAGGYLVVAKDAARLRSNYPALNGANVVGDFDGSLSGRGERLALAKPGFIVATNKFSAAVTNTIYIAVDELTYRSGGRWGNWAHEGGSSLELRDPRTNHRLASNWADSDETAKAPWTTIEATGVLDNGAGLNGGPIDNLQVVMLGESECLLDDVEVLRPGSTNLIANTSFESDLAGWTAQGNHVRSTLETIGGFNSNQSLHIRASSRGDTGANRVWTRLTSSPTANQTLTIRAKARWLRGWPEIVLRVHGNWMDAVGRLSVPTNLGTPGARNSRALNNAGPAIFEVAHSPILPAANQPVAVTARVHDADGIASLLLKYRVDPSTAYATAPLRDDGTGADEIAGDGIYTARIPAQTANTLVAFSLEALDPLGASTTFPDDAPLRECLVRFGDPAPISGFGIYRQWFTQSALATWNNRPTLSNERLDGTFVYGNFRVIYNFGSRYAGSPYHQGFGSPLSDGHYSIEFPLDDLLLGTENFNKVHAPGNGPFDDTTIQREQICFWIARQLGLPWNYRRYVAMYVNGTRRGTLMEDTQVPGSEMINEYFPDDTDGFLYKIQPWFEFDSSNSRTMAFSNNSWCTLNNYTTGGQKKLARYRWNFLARAANGTANNYTNVYALVDAANASGNTAQATNLETVADMEEWMRIFAVRHSVGDWDSFGAQNEQNMYGYKPINGKWTLFIWDMNIVLGNSGSWGPGQNLFTLNGADAPMQRIYNNPPFRRAYWRALKEISTGPMDSSRIDRVLDAKYAAFRAEGITVTSPAILKSWVASARTSILSQAAAVDAPALTVTGPATASDNFVLLTGTAPVDVKTLTVNGIAYPATWTSMTAWTMRVPVNSANNTLTARGHDIRGNLIANMVATVSVNYTGPVELPQDYLVINELMYNPAVTNASFVEIFNRSANFTFDLSNYRLNGLDYTFPEGSSLAPQSFLILAKDRAAFSAAYGNSVRVFDQFDGKLDPDGETITLLRPGATPAQETVISKVRYENQAPWPVLGGDNGVSLQLIDPAQDHRRAGNWTASLTLPLRTPGTINSVRKDLVPFPTLWINEIQPENLNGLKDSAGETDPWLELYNNGSGAVSLDGLFLTDNYSNLTRWAFPSGIQLKPGEFKAIFADGQTSQTTSAELHANFRLRPGSGSVALSRVSNGQPEVLDYISYSGVRAGRSFGSFPDGQPFDRQEFFSVTPGAPNNSISAPLSVWINEWMASNTLSVTDPADGQFDDWFELYNPATKAADLTGYYLTDNLTNKFTFLIPPGYSIPPLGYLLVWADDEVKQNSAARSDLHVNFKLSKAGQQIGLFAADGTLIDSISVGPQTSDASQGRSPDGNRAIDLMKQPTPRSANIATQSNGSPRFRQTVLRGAQLTLEWEALPGSTYRVEFKNSLSESQWVPLGSGTSATGATLSTIIDIATNAQRFYRVVRLN